MSWRRSLGLLALAAVAACSSSGGTGGPGPTAPSRPTASSSGSSSASSPVAPGPVPRFAHIVVVVEENHGYGQILTTPSARYLRELAATGALLTDSFAVAHPSEPNYVALFSGSAHGLRSDACPLRYPGPDLYSALRAVGKAFAGYAEDLPHAGSAVCSSGAYARKHAPWTDFPDVPASAQQPFTAFPRDLTQLPAVSFVIPNLEHDMHDGSIADADAWLRRHLAGYVTWARTHDSLLIVTFDEDDTAENNHIMTVLAGAQLRPGLRSAQHVDHFSVLRTIEDAFGTRHLGSSADRVPIAGVWR